MLLWIYSGLCGIWATQLIGVDIAMGRSQDPNLLSCSHLIRIAGTYLQFRTQHFWPQFCLVFSMEAPAAISSHEETLVGDTIP